MKLLLSIGLQGKLPEKAPKQEHGGSQQGLKDSVRHVKLHRLDGCSHAKNQYLDEREGGCASGNVARQLTGVCCCLRISRCAKLKGLSAICALKSSTTVLRTTQLCTGEESKRRRTHINRLRAV